MALGLSVIDYTTLLNFDDVSTILHYNEMYDLLNFEDITSKSQYSDSSVQLNFSIKDYMEGTIIYKVLIDWLENYSVGDIFVVET